MRGGMRRLTTSQTGIHRRLNIPVTTNGRRHEYVIAIAVQIGASANPMLKPIWLTAAPKACSLGFRYRPLTLPTEGTPADSLAARADRQRNKPGTDLTS